VVSIAEKVILTNKKYIAESAGWQLIYDAMLQVFIFYVRTN